MNKPDLLLTQIKHADYPIFRARLKKERDFFGKIIVYFNENNRFPYFDHFIQSAMSDLGNIIFLDQAEMQWGVQDWRNVSTNEMLKHSTSEWVCSVEQDWFDRNWDKTLHSVIEAMENADLIGWENQATHYIHPAFWFMKREALEKTKKDFSAHDGYDHFGWITKEARDLGIKITSLQDLGFSTDVEPNADCFHLGGVNQNYLEGMKDGFVFHRPEEFLVYNYECRQVDIVQDPRFLALSQEIEAKLIQQFDTNITNNQWTKFFKV